MSGTSVPGHQNCCVCHPDYKGEADGRPRPPSRKGSFAMPARDRRRLDPREVAGLVTDEYGLGIYTEYARHDTATSYDTDDWWFDDLPGGVGFS